MEEESETKKERGAVLQCEDCMWEEAEGEGEEEKEGEQERRRASREWAVCLVCEKNDTYLCVCVCVCVRVCCIVVASLFTSLFSSCAAQLGLRDHAAGVHSSLDLFCSAGADGAPGVRLRLPASPV